jgi:hypothetical protein
MVPDRNGSVLDISLTVPAMWKDDKVGKSGLHGWINRNKPNPISGLCEICNVVPFYDAACVTLIYNRDFENWKYACRSCHRKIDFENGSRSHERISIAMSGERNPMYGKRGKKGPTYRKKVYSCYACDSQTTFINKKGVEVWHLNGGTDFVLCHKCFHIIERGLKKGVGEQVKAVGISPLTQKNDEPESIMVWVNQKEIEK